MMFYIFEKKLGGSATVKGGDGGWGRYSCGGIAENFKKIRDSGIKTNLEIMCYRSFRQITEKFPTHKSAMGFHNKFWIMLNILNSQKPSLAIRNPSGDEYAQPR